MCGQQKIFFLNPKMIYLQKPELIHLQKPELIHLQKPELIHLQKPEFDSFACQENKADRNGSSSSSSRKHSSEVEKKLEFSHFYFSSEIQILPFFFFSSFKISNFLPILDVAAPPSAPSNQTSKNFFCFQKFFHLSNLNGILRNFSSFKLK